MCKQCMDNCGTFWELWFCDKNPNGLIHPPMEHGNIIDDTTTCEDGYCNPRTTAWTHGTPTNKSLRTFELHERCNTCGTIIESLG